jgi:hypothetical protein
MASEGANCADRAHFLKFLDWGRPRSILHRSQSETTKACKSFQRVTTLDDSESLSKGWSKFVLSRNQSTFCCTSETNHTMKEYSTTWILCWRQKTIQM